MGGIESDTEARRRVALLEEQLRAVQGNLVEAFADLRLVRPGKASFSNGVYEFTVNDLTGPTTPFPEVQIEVLHPLDEKCLYLHDLRRSDALELAPFIRMGPPSQDNTACYFYNRLDGAQTRWLSYHHEDEAEFTAEDAKLSGFLDRLAGGRAGA
jgi:hypothetical protein